MPKTKRTTRYDEDMVTNGRERSTHTTAGPSSGIESSIAAGGSRSARRYGGGSTTKTVTFTQIMPVPSEKSHRRHTAKRKEPHKGSKVEIEHGKHRRTREAEPDSEDDYVYPQERRSKKETKQRYEEVRRLGRDEEDDEVEADERQDERDIEDERRRRAERSKSSPYHHHRHHKHHHHHRDRVEEERSKGHRSHLHQRTPSEQREHDERKAEKRARRAEREEREARDLPQSSRTHREKHTEPVTRPGLFSGLFRRANSTPAPTVDRPHTRKSFSESQLSRPRRERDDCDEGLPIVFERSQKHKHKHKHRHEHEKKKEKPTGFLGMFIPAAKEPKIEAPVKVVSCIVCLDDEVKFTRAKKLKCGHRQCHSCLRRGFKLSLTDPQQMPPKCCTSDPIPLRAVDKLFPDQWKKKWNRKYEEYTTKNRIYCPAKKCGEWIRPEDIKRIEGKKQGICRKCKTKVCGTCNAKWHGARDCPKDAETNALLETAREAGWQRCYSCRTLVELKEGCNHMTCRCTAEFCMLCGLKWRTCECPWFNYETVEADRLAHIRVPGDIGGGRPPPPPPPLFPRRMPNAFAAFLPPPRPMDQQANMMANQAPINAFQVLNQNLRDFGANFNTNQDQVQERAQQRQERLRQQRQDLHQQQQFDERQQRMRADEEFARNMESLNVTREEATPARRGRQASAAGSETPASVQAGIARGQRGSRRVDMWMENVPFQPRAQPVR